MTEKTLLALSNRLEIIELTYRYAFLLDTHQLDLLMELWSDESPVFDQESFMLGKSIGKDEILKKLETAIYGQMEILCHLTSNNVINDLTESKASGTCTVLAEGDVRAGGSSWATAYYQDEYVHENGRWKFASRKVTPLTNPKQGLFELPDGTE